MHARRSGIASALVLSLALCTTCCRSVRPLCAMRLRSIARMKTIQEPACWLRLAHGGTGGGLDDHGQSLFFQPLPPLPSSCFLQRLHTQRPVRHVKAAGYLRVPPPSACREAASHMHCCMRPRWTHCRASCAQCVHDHIGAHALDLPRRRPYNLSRLTCASRSTLTHVAQTLAYLVPEFIDITSNWRFGPKAAQLGSKLISLGRVEISPKLIEAVYGRRKPRGGRTPPTSGRSRSKLARHRPRIGGITTP